MNEALVKLRFKIDRLTLRERIMILSSALVVILCIWFYLFYSVQQKTLQQTSAEAELVKNEIAASNQKMFIIRSLLADDTIQKLIHRHGTLREELKKFEFQKQQYDNRYINEEELAKLLYSMLEKTDRITIESFGNVDFDQTASAQSVAPASAVQVVSATTSEQAAEMQPPPIERVQYFLVLNDDYFSIMEYLQRLEKLKWELYWDKLTYEVKKYPQARVSIEFYTLQPGSVVPTPLVGGAQ